MDFMKILRSFEEVLFEAASWLVFYPLTLWRVIRRPLSTMDYSDREQADVEEHRYDDALSPPPVLLITIVLCNLVGSAAHVPPPPETSELMRTLAGSQQNLILFRSLIYSLIPLISAVSLLHRQGKQISRETLRAPFYAQCYLAAPLAIFMSAGGIVFQRPDLANIIGMVVMIAGAVWFMVIQTTWFRGKLGISTWKASMVAAWAVARALACLIVIAIPIALI